LLLYLAFLFRCIVRCHLVVSLCVLFFKAIFQFSLSFQIFFADLEPAVLQYHSFFSSASVALCFCWSSRFLGFVVPGPVWFVVFVCHQSISLFLIEVVMTQEQPCNKSIFIQYSHCSSFVIVSVLSWCVVAVFVVCVRPVSLQ